MLKIQWYWSEMRWNVCQRMFISFQFSSFHFYSDLLFDDPIFKGLFTDCLNTAFPLCCLQTLKKHVCRRSQLRYVFESHCLLFSMTLIIAAFKREGSWPCSPQRVSLRGTNSTNSWYQNRGAARAFVVTFTDVIITRVDILRRIMRPRDKRRVRWTSCRRAIVCSAWVSPLEFYTVAKL